MRVFLVRPSGLACNNQDQAVLQEEADVASDVLLPMPNAAKAGGVQEPSDSPIESKPTRPS
eukprot:2990237-Amphidinium_carterae.1